VLAELEHCAGAHFDPEVAQALIAVLRRQLSSLAKAS
jgi:HD-GYP domain-containing protein (c-di-GMP phosphodiesterase class II)